MLVKRDRDLPNTNTITNTVFFPITPMTAQRSDTIWTKTFILLCAAQLLGYAQHFMLAPVLPLYVTQLGGSPLVVGAVLACFAVTSVIVRPLVGHWVDRWSEAGVMISGMCFQAVSVFFLFIPFIPFTALANSLRGIGWGGLNTGGYSLLARIAPESRRGAASGLYSGVQSSAQIFFPPIALWLLYASFGGYRAVFIVTAIFSIAGAVTGLIWRRWWPGPRRRRPSKKRRRGGARSFTLSNRKFCCRRCSSSGSMFRCRRLPISLFSTPKNSASSNFGAYFIVIGATSMLGRPLLGRLSDRIGRARSIAAGFVLQVAGLFLFTFVSELLGVIVCGALYMLGNAIGSSTTLALAVERADPQRRGKQMATFSVAYPLSYGLGSCSPAAP